MVAHKPLTPQPARSASSPIDPFVALDQTHVEVMDRLRTLQRLPGHLLACGVDAQARGMAADLCAFFGNTARRHHIDEERDIFPPLLRSNDAELVQQVRRLQQDHGWLEQDWLELSASLQAVAAGYDGYELDALREGIAVFVALYHEHIGLEESLIYPEARRRRAAERAADERRQQGAPLPH
jgi:hemerythrin-like domain-containing protein